MKRKIIIGILAIITLIALYRITVFTIKKIFPKEAKEEIRKIPVKAVAVKKMNITEKLKLNGNIKGIDAVKIYPHVPGKIQYILVKEGQRVRRGKQLFKINRDLIGMEFRLAPVQSPISGFIGKIYVDRGMTVTQATPIAEVVNMSSVEAVVQIIEEDINRVKTGMLADIRVRTYPDKKFKGIVYKKSAILNELSRTQEVHLKIKNPGLKLKHGMFADVDIILNKRKNVYVVPEDAIFKNKDGLLCLYKIDNLTAIMQIVKVGISSNNLQEIKQGITEKDIIITLGHENVTNGDKLIVYREDQETEKILQKDIQKKKKIKSLQSGKRGKK